MLKLMKYEFRKQAFSKLVIGVLLGLLEVIFLFGVIVESEKVLGFSMGFLVLLTFGALFFLAFESIITYSNDLKQKCSYMLFLTPNSTYSIVGAKVMSAAIQVFLSGIAFVVLYAVNGAILVAKYATIAELKQMIEKFLQIVLKLDVNTTGILLGVTVLLFAWINTITLAFFSITLSTTFLADKKYKGVVSFAIYLILNYAYSKITQLALYKVNILDSTNIYFVLNILFLLCFTIITYIGTAWMLDKKVSV